MHVKVIYGLTCACSFLDRDSGRICAVLILQEFSQKLHCKGHLEKFLSVKLPVTWLLASWTYQNIYNHHHHFKVRFAYVLLLLGLVQPLQTLSL